jgi:hypothetical protein
MGPDWFFHHLQLLALLWLCVLLVWMWLWGRDGTSPTTPTSAWRSPAGSTAAGRRVERASVRFPTPRPLAPSAGPIDASRHGRLRLLH